MGRDVIPKALQELVRKRAKGYCEYCLSPAGFTPDIFPIDHIIPVGKGGKAESNNLAFSCGGCNSFKHDKIAFFDPLTNHEAQLYHPRKDDWYSHFQWNEDATLIVGITPIGRATVALLRMNRAGNVNLRGLLIMAGLHPPAVYPEG